ncbi:MAG: hypothetical protein K8S94_14885 [Planctomycetia bacterium]|nr:hypothetical protein [Planctomycetia bacterium]
MDAPIIVYRRTATASTYFMRGFAGAYATLPVADIDLSRRCFNTEYEPVVRHLLEHLEGPLLIVNLVRRPRARFVSQFFKNLANEQIRHPCSGEWIASPLAVGGDLSYDNLARVYRRSLGEFFIPHDYGIERTYPALFGVDLSSQAFDYDRRCLHFAHGRFTFLTLRQEDVAEWPRIMHAALGMEAVFPSRRVNAASEKPHAALYEEFVRHFRYTDEETRQLDALLTAKKYYAS